MFAPRVMTCLIVNAWPRIYSRYNLLCVIVAVKRLLLGSYCICEASGDVTDTDRDSEVYISGKSHMRLNIFSSEMTTSLCLLWMGCEGLFENKRFYENVFLLSLWG